MCPGTSLSSQNARSSAALPSPTGKGKIETNCHSSPLPYLECESMTTSIERMYDEDAEAIHPREPHPSKQEQKPQEGHLWGEMLQSHGKHGRTNLHAADPDGCPSAKFFPGKRKCYFWTSKTSLGQLPQGLDRHAAAKRLDWPLEFPAAVSKLQPAPQSALYR